MRLVRLKVKNVGTLLGEIDTGELDPSLTVVHGPNETGKSTLLAALHAAIFQRHGSQIQPLKDLQPFGRGDLAPEVWVTLERCDERIEIHKRFLKQPTAELTVRGERSETLSGDEAERRIREIMDVDSPGRQGIKPEQMGIWWLLWPDQRQAGANPNEALLETPRARLRHMLTDLVGEVTSGPEGERLLALAGEERRRYLTDRNRQPTGEYRRAIDQEARAHEQLDATRQRYLAGQAQADELAQTRRSLTDKQARLDEARTARDTAREKRRELDSLQAKCESARQQLEATQAALDHARSRSEARTAAVGNIDERRQAICRQEESLEPLRTQLAEATEQLERARQSLAHAEKRRQAAATRCDRLRDDRELLRIEADLSEQERRLERAEALVTRLDDVNEGLVAQILSDEDLAKLTQLAQQIAQARGMVEAVATRVTICARTDLPIRKADDEPETLEAGGERTESVAEPTEFALGDVASVRVEPGGDDLPKRRERLEALESDQQRALGELGVETLDEARTRAAERAALASDASQIKAELAGVAPDGIDTIRNEVAKVRTKLEALQKSRPSDEPPPDAETIDQQIGQAENDLTENQEAEADARGKLDVARSDVERLKESVGTSEAQLVSAKDELRRAEQALETDRSERGSDEDLDKRLCEALEARQARQDDVEGLLQRLNALDPETVRDEANRTEAVVTQLSQEIERLQARERELTGQVRQAGTEGLREQLDQAEETHRLAQDTRDRLARQARAAAKLEEVLETARDEAQQAFTEPLRRAIGELLTVLMPEAQADITGELDLTGVVRDGAAEPFDLLSQGMREQLGVLTRLALARLLAGDGHRLPVILDDALVSCDAARFERMIQVIRRACRDLQVIILTCHPDRYVQLGAGSVIDLAQLKRAARDEV